MDIFEQCDNWFLNTEYQKVIDTLEAIPASERTPQMDSELALAYEFLAVSYKTITKPNGREMIIPEGRELLKKGIALLEPHEEYFEGDHFWNFRMGGCYFYLDQHSKALRYYRAALKALPGDECTDGFVRKCEELISLPRFQQCFRERTESAWKAFAEQETELRRMVGKDDSYNNPHASEVLAKTKKILNLAFDEISYAIGYAGKKYVLYLIPERDKAKLFELLYFQKHAPKNVLKHWNIIMGRPPEKNVGLHTKDGYDISDSDVKIWLDERKEEDFAVSFYCEKLLPLLRKDKERVMVIFDDLIEQELGEIPLMRYIKKYDILREPKEEPGILLSQLPDALRKKVLNFSADPEDYLCTCIAYEMQPQENPSADWRLDAIYGLSRCDELIVSYVKANTNPMDNLHDDGVVAGFFCYPLGTLYEEHDNQKIHDFYIKLGKALIADDGKEGLAILGEATGLFCRYVDFIAWDLEIALNKAKKFFADTDVPWAVFHTFRRGARAVFLKNPPEDTQPRV